MYLHLCLHAFLKGKKKIINWKAFEQNQRKHLDSKVSQEQFLNFSYLENRKCKLRP